MSQDLEHEMDRWSGDASVVMWVLHRSVAVGWKIKLLF